jgi:4-hydroxyproline epimerase
MLAGAILCKASDPACESGAIFFDSIGYLDISVHGLIGLTVTLEYLGRLQTGLHRIETPAGIVTVELHPAGDFSVQNVASFRHLKDVNVTAAGTNYSGDVAWGGRWSFLVNKHHEELTAARVDRLTDVARSIRTALARDRITGPKGEAIDDVALFGPPWRGDAQSRNFVLHGGKTWRRSPGGTALSAKLACLHADGKLAEGQIWRQESIAGTVFDGSVTVVEGATRPTIRSTGHVTADSMLIIDQRDPLSWGLPQA